MKSITENAAIDFRIALDTYKHIKGFNDAQIAEVLGCDAQTVSNMRRNPLGASSRYTLVLLQRLKIEERNRYV